jgi:transcription initiation factor TFIIIB Brf1 subunit/transcription initiation factor TFIIB
MKCPNCNGSIVYPEGLEGERICSRCGLVIEQTPTVKSYSQWTPEWYSNYSQKDSETIKEWLTTLRAVSCQLNIPNFPYREEAARTIRTQTQLLTKSQTLSKNKRTTVAAIMHLVLKEYNKLRPIKDISRELGLDNRSVMKQTWLLNKTLSAKKTTIKISRKTAIDYLHEFAGKLTEERDLLLDAEKTLIQLRRAGGNPVGLAAGAFYNVCKKNKNKVTKEKIGEAFRISERTVYTNEARIRKLTSKSATTPLAIVDYTQELSCVIC